MTEKKTKRFTVQIREGTTAYEIKDNERELPMMEALYYKYNTEKLCEFLNKMDRENKRLYEDNIRIKQLVTTAFNNEEDERIGKVLRGLIENM